MGESWWTSHEWKRAESRMRREIDALANQREHLRKRLEEALAVLRRVEWVDNDKDPNRGVHTAWCPWCKSTMKEKHKPDCARQKALEPLP